MASILKCYWLCTVSMGHHTHPFIKPYILSPAPHKQTCGRCHTRQEGGRQIVPRLMYGSVYWLFAPLPTASRSVFHPHSLYITRNVQIQEMKRVRAARESEKHIGNAAECQEWGVGRGRACWVRALRRCSLARSSDKLLHADRKAGGSTDRWSGRG